MKKITREWLSAAKDDLDAIDKIIVDENLGNVAAFHAQQAIEKSFKAVMEEREIVQQKIHSLVTLYYKIEGTLKVDVDFTKLEKLDKLYIDARYPGELGLLPDGKPSLAEAEQFYEFAQNVFDQVNKALKQANDDSTDKPKGEVNRQ